MTTSIISRTEALKLGLKRYFTDEPCKHGHLSERLSSTRSCLKCNSEHRKRNRDKTAAASRRHRKLNPEKQALYRQKYRAKPETSEKEQRYSKKYQQRPEVRERKKLYAIEYAKRPEAKAKRAEYRRSETGREKARQYAKKRRSTPEGRINNRIGRGMNRVLRNGKNGVSWQRLVGYKADDLRQHIERQFTKGMSWDVFMRGEIHIDHIVPKSAFNFVSDADANVKACWALSNLRPMWALANMVKGDRRTALI